MKRVFSIIIFIFFIFELNAIGEESNFNVRELKDFPDVLILHFTEAEKKEGNASPAAAQRIVKDRHIFIVKAYERVFLAKRNLPAERSPFKPLLIKVEQHDYSKIQDLKSFNEQNLFYRIQTYLILVTSIFDSLDTYLLNSKEFVSLKSQVSNPKKPAAESLLSKNRITELLIILALNFLLTLAVIQYLK